MRSPSKTRAMKRPRGFVSARMIKKNTANCRTPFVVMGRFPSGRALEALRPQQGVDQVREEEQRCHSGDDVIHTVNSLPFRQALENSCIDPSLTLGAENRGVDPSLTLGAQKRSRGRGSAVPGDDPSLTLGAQKRATSPLPYGRGSERRLRNAIGGRSELLAEAGQGPAGDEEEQRYRDIEQIEHGCLTVFWR